MVNNAGVCRLEKFEAMNDELRDFHFDINIKGTWNVTRVCLPYMKNRGASIVNLSRLIFFLIDILFPDESTKEIYE